MNEQIHGVFIGQFDLSTSYVFRWFLKTQTRKQTKLFLVVGNRVSMMINFFLFFKSFLFQLFQFPLLPPPPASSPPSPHPVPPSTPWEVNKVCQSRWRRTKPIPPCMELSKVSLHRKWGKKKKSQFMHRGQILVPLPVASLASHSDDFPTCEWK